MTKYIELPSGAHDEPEWNGFSFTGWNAPLLNVPVGPGFHPNGVHKGHTAWDQQYRDVGEIRQPVLNEEDKKLIEENYGLETARWLSGVEGGNGYRLVKIAVVALWKAYERGGEPGKQGEPVTGTLRGTDGKKYRLFFWVRDLGPKSMETGWAWRLVPASQVTS